MFTGLIETTGTVLSFTPSKGAARVTLTAPALSGRWKTGDSIAVNGVCLTAIPVGDPAHFAADLATETLERTTLAQLGPGSVVNLELPTPAGAPLGGHVVQGHADGTGKVVSIAPLQSDRATTDWRFALEIPAQMRNHVVQQGSITVDGISLTIAKLEGLRVEIAIIPHTYESTNLHTLLPGDAVNIEADVLAKYAAQRNRPSEDWLTTEYLLANGY
jgi:riboflavin synthase